MTLWPFHVDDYSFPFTKDKFGAIKDSQGREVNVYAETFQVLEKLQKLCIDLAIASRIEQVSAAYQLLHLFNLRHYFIYVEIYPTRKTLHFEQLKKKTEVEFNDMVFYDDDERNLKCVGKLGVNVHQVRNGLSLDQVQL